METNTNLKRRRDSGETQAKKLCTQPNPTIEKELHTQLPSKATSQQPPAQALAQQSPKQFPPNHPQRSLPQQSLLPQQPTLPQQSPHHKTPFSPIILSLSLSLSPSRLFSRSRSLKRLPNNNPDQKHSHPQPSKALPRTRSASSKEDGQKLLGVALCYAEP